MFFYENFTAHNFNIKNAAKTQKTDIAHVKPLN
jgi:hypothetical protein